MSIEITGPVSTPVSGQGGGAEVQGTTPNPTPSQAKGTNNNSAHLTDSVTITSSAVHLQAAERRLKGIPLVDEARVERIRNSIENGEYNIDPAKIADKFIKLETALYH